VLSEEFMRAGKLRPSLRSRLGERLTRALVRASAALLIALATPRDAHTACSSPTPMFHGFDSYIQCADGWPITSFAWQVSDPAINTGTLGITCRTLGENSGACVSPISGEVGDGRVTVETDWSTPGVNGCPVNATGPGRVALSIQCADGTGVVISLSGANPNFGYVVELAHHTDGTTILPIVAGTDSGQPRLISRSDSDGVLTATVHFDPVRIHCDCDPQSVGFGIDPGSGGTACTDGFACTGSAGTVHTGVGPCGYSPGAPTGYWNSTGVAPDAEGNATITAPLPTTVDSCLYIGAPTVIAGIPGSGITGFIAIPSLLVASDRVVAIDVATTRGKVSVSFRTESEFEAVSFDVLAGGRVVASIPAAGGNGLGAHYEAALSLGDLRGARELRVRTNLRNGGFNMSDPVSLPRGR
jgi:hypothetical protein